MLRTYRNSTSIGSFRCFTTFPLLPCPVHMRHHIVQPRHSQSQKLRLQTLEQRSLKPVLNTAHSSTSQRSRYDDTDAIHAAASQSFQPIKQLLLTTNHCLFTTTTHPIPSHHTDNTQCLLLSSVTLRLAVLSSSRTAPPPVSSPSLSRSSTTTG